MEGASEGGLPVADEGGAGSTLLDQLLSLGEAEEVMRLVSFTVASSTADMASVVCFDGSEARLPASEWFADRPWSRGGRHHGVLLAGEGRYVSVVRPEQLTLMLAGLVPEVRSGVVQVKGVARLAGVRAKVAVASSDAQVDPVAACVGRKASRIRYLVEQLGGERVDIIPWTPDPRALLAAALAPAQVEGIRFDGRRAQVHVPAHRMAATVGGGGLNSQLAGQLSGYNVQVVAV